MKEIHISLPAETIAKIGPLPITNSLIITWIVMVFLISLSIIVNSKIKKYPGRLQTIVELIIGGLFSFFRAINGEHTKTFFPLLATIFIFVLASNWVGLLPGLNSITYNHIPILRAPSTDLNFTMALAIISVSTIQWFGIKNLGSTYIKKFINFSSPANFFVGILEIISEISRVISFAFRLFGNIFAGEVLLTVVAFILPTYLLFGQLPFLGLEIFVGLVQALVFSMLTAVFLNVAISEH